MEIYIAIRAADYESSLLLGAAFTKEKAKELCAADYRERMGRPAIFDWAPNFYESHVLEGQMPGDFSYYFIHPTEVQ